MRRIWYSAEPEQPAETDTVKPAERLTYGWWRRRLTADVATLRTLNPSLLRNGDAGRSVVCAAPAEGTEKTFSAEIADIPADKMGKLAAAPGESGETLTSIAKKYRVTPGAIAAANDLEARTGWKPERSSIIPAARPVEETKSRLVRLPGDELYGRQGDTLSGRDQSWLGPAFRHFAHRILRSLRLE